MRVVDRDRISGIIIAAAIEIHRLMGPGLLESAYIACLVHELIRRGLRVERQVAVPVVFKGAKLDCGFRLDLLVEGDVIVEVKSVEKLAPIHSAQVLTYLRLTGARRALLMNFGGLTLKAGLKSYLGRSTQVPVSSD